MLWLVLSLAVVLGVMFFSFHLSVRQRNAQAHAVHFGQVALSLAQSGANLAFHQLRRQVEDRESGLVRDLVQLDPLVLVGHQIPLDLQARLLRLTEGMGADLGVEVTAEVLASGPLDEARDTARGYDPLEKRLKLEILSRGSYRGIERVVREVRELRIQLDTLPVLGRFTLLVRNPERTRPGEPGYNRFANDINGAMDLETVSPRDNYLPLALYNHGDTFPALHHDLEENGWVYLGGRDPIQLNLTSGADYQYGQYFHFYNFLAADTSKQAAFLAEAPPPFFNASYPVPGGAHRYFLKHVIYGFFTRDRGTPPADMNRDGVLDLALEADANARSSTLHLFGSTLSPSPTRVLGNVYHAFPIYSGITVDIDDDGRRDGVVRLVPSVDAAGYANLALTHPIPGLVRHIGRPGQTIHIPSSVVTWPAMFPDYETYELFMSTIVRREPYNAGVDYMFARGEFPPEEQALDPTHDYPNPGDDVTIRRRGGGEDPVHFEGDPGQFDAAELVHRAVLEVADAEELLARFLRPGPVLELGRPVRLARGDLALPPDLWVERGGMLVVPGSITLDGLRCKSGERLSLVSLTGSITSPFDRSGPERPVEADLVALAGRVASSERGHPMGVFGTLAAGRLAPADFPSGGRLVYDRAADPAGPERATLARAHLSDRPERWDL